MWKMSAQDARILRVYVCVSSYILFTLRVLALSGRPERTRTVDACFGCLCGYAARGRASAILSVTFCQSSSAILSVCHFGTAFVSRFVPPSGRTKKKCTFFRENALFFEFGTVIVYYIVSNVLKIDPYRNGGTQRGQR